MIAISLSPNTEPDDVFLALKLLFQPWKWQRGNAHVSVESWFQKKYATPHVVLYNSGRSALYEILKAYGIGTGDEVIIQPFTCIAVPNSIHWTGAKPVFVDIDKSYNINPWLIERAITPKTKAIVVQHTFGIPAEIDKIVTIAKKRKLIIIEDCAHALGATYKGKLLGTWGEAAFFSFGRDKVLSSVFGGVGIVRKDQDHAAGKMQEGFVVLPDNRWWWIFQQLFHPVAFAIILLTYRLQLGKVLLVVLQKLHLLSFPVYQEEKTGHQPADFPRRFPNGLAALAFHQLHKLDRFNAVRKEVAAAYRSALKKYPSFTLPPDRAGAIYLRFPVLHPQSTSVIYNAKAGSILLGNWYHCGIDPKGSKYPDLPDSIDQFPVAKNASEHILNLPTRITSTQAQRVISVLQ